MARNIRQYDRSITGRRPRIIALAVVLTISLTAIIGSIIYRSTRPYEAPPFEETAVAGVPEPPKELGFGYGGAGTEDSFRVGLVSKWTRDRDGSLPVWFANPPENAAKLMLRIRRVSDNRILYQSGLIRPGEYVEKLTPMMELAEGPVDVRVSVYSFDEDYHSLGTLQLSGTVE